MAKNKSAAKNPPQPSLKIESVAIAALTPDPNNAMLHGPRNIKAVADSLREFGQRTPIVIDDKNKVLKGNGTLEAAKSLGWTHIDATRTDLSGKAAMAYALADNRSSQLAEFDDAILLEQLRDLEKSSPELLASLAWTPAELLELDKSPVSEIDAEPQLDRAEELKGIWNTEPGQIWELGKHRLICGDSTKPEVITALMNGERATMCFTDPPWNVAIGKDRNPRHRQRAGLENADMSAADFRGFIAKFSQQVTAVVSGDLYCVLGASEWPTLDSVLRENGFHWSATIIWVKDIFVLGRSKYHGRYEPLWYGWHTKGKSSYCGARDQDDVWEIPRPRVSAEHPTMKPVELCQRAIANSSRAADIVFEPFAGGGSTILAAERLQRRCYAAEIAPPFVAVCLQRFKDATGIEPKLLA